MITNELLEEKWRVQQKLAEIAGYNIKEMLDNAEKTVKEIQEKYGYKIIISKRKPEIPVKGK
jgi:hypothetical protein